MKLITVETGETIRTASEKYDSLDDLIDHIENLTTGFINGDVQSEKIEVVQPSIIPESQESVKPLSPAGNKRHAIDFGLVVMANETENEPMITGEIGYTYSFFDFLAVGVLIIPVFHLDLDSPIIGGLRLILFDRSEAAFGITIGKPFAISMFFQNLYVTAGSLDFIEGVTDFEDTTLSVSVGYGISF